MPAYPEILISEVGPRDGLQSVKATMATANKLRWIDALVASGLREIEVCSFVPARHLPQMADAAEVVRHAFRHPGVTIMALVPNLRGAEAALQAGVHKLTIPVSASAAHSLANVRKTREEMIEEVRAIVRLRDDIAPGVMIEAGMSTAFGCTLQGAVAEDDVVWLAGELVAAGVNEVGLSDTTGMANPAQVRRLFNRVRAAIGARTGAAHMHNTRGLGLANCLAAYDVGVRTFDSSLGGLGGCPYAPGASGNVVTEDLVFMFEAMGITTGVDLDKLMAARTPLQAGLPGEPLYGMTPEAGLPKGWIPRPASAAPRPQSDMNTPKGRAKPLPYAGLRVVEFTHMVMGPTCGLVLADLGAEVIKVEPIGHGRAGDATRQLLGSGAGFFPMFNRNKKSLALDLQTPQGKEAVLRLIATADIVSENFKPGTMKKLGLDYASLKALNPRLIYVSHKGFLPGPYEQRTALDEVVQMMGGLAYMTGRPGDPLRAGTSVNDIMGGLFGAIGAMAALSAREKTGLGQEVQSALFENNVFLVAQHMMQFAVTGQAAAPMPARISAWAVYDVFKVKDDEQIFLAVVSDTAWALFCEAFGFADLQNDARLRSNNDRVRARDWMMPLLRERLVKYSAAELSAVFEQNALPFAPITRPQDLLDDPHLNATGGLAPISLPDGRQTKTVLLPLTLDGARPGVRLSPPRLGEHSAELLAELGYSAIEIEALCAC
jgi:crotonobetainyl-CoA:carnitine CoA-transferase CaiB-like acyl-CoA transferase